MSGLAFPFIWDHRCKEISFHRVRNIHLLGVRSSESVWAEQDFTPRMRYLFASVKNLHIPGIYATYCVSPAKAPG
jgi:hypothetical protein